MEKEKYPQLPVLVVDDEKHFLNSIEYILLSRGITNVECCQDSSEVMARLKSKKYSVILLDLKMQGITGEKLLADIVEEYPDIPVIILTAVGEVDIAVNCMKQGAFDYLVKPLDTEKLIKTIQNALGERSKTGGEVQKVINTTNITKIPYYFGSYIKDSEDFYGRKEQLTQIIQKIKEAENNRFWHISVVGDYRLGKSSLLKRLEYEIESKNKSISVYIDLSGLSQDHFTRSIIGRIMANSDKKLGENFYEKIKNSLKNKASNKLKSIGLDISIIGLFTINFNPKEGNHWEIFFNALDVMIEKVKTRGYKSIVLILDEINAITKWSDYREILQKLRSCAQKVKGLNLLVGSSYPLYQLSRDEWYPFFNIFYKQNLRELDEDEAGELIKSPASDVGIHYSDEAVNLIKMLCGNKPYYIQVLCTKIFENLREGKSVPGIINTSIVEAAIEDTLEQLNSHLTQIFEKCTDYQKNLLLSIAHKNDEETKKFFSDDTKKNERDMLRDRVLIYKFEKECKIDGLMERWLLRDYGDRGTVHLVKPVATEKPIKPIQNALDTKTFKSLSPAGKKLMNLQKKIQEKLAELKDFENKLVDENDFIIRQEYENDLLQCKTLADQFQEEYHQLGKDAKPNDNELNINTGDLLERLFYFISKLVQILQQKKLLDHYQVDGTSHIVSDVLKMVDIETLKDLEAIVVHSDEFEDIIIHKVVTDARDFVSRVKDGSVNCKHHAFKKQIQRAANEISSIKDVKIKFNLYLPFIPLILNNKGEFECKRHPGINLDIELKFLGQRWSQLLEKINQKKR